MPLRVSPAGAWRRPSFWKLIFKLPSLLKLVRKLLVDGRVPITAKLVFGLSVAYVLWPLDLLPDFALPLIGQIDDLTILLAGLKVLLNGAPSAVLEEHLGKTS
jgi:uncharacterized membrane protein YkvA (DUF1232 family)